MEIVSLLKMIDKFHELSLYPAFGIEVEFYIINSDPININSFIANLQELGINIKEERGVNQYEFTTNVYTDVIKLIDEQRFIRNTITDIAKQNNLEISFSPKPYPNDYGSSMQINMSILNESGDNVFNQYASIEENQFLLECIGGILAITNESLYMIIGDDPEETLRINSRMMSPAFINWGKNNRTTLIRIPDSPPCSRNRRIEFRLPSASASLEKCLLFIATATMYGIKNKTKPPQCTYGEYEDVGVGAIKIRTTNIKELFCFESLFEEVLKL